MSEKTHVLNGPSRDAHQEFEALVSRTKRQAYNLAYRMTGNRDDAEDLTQEAYLRAYRSFDKYNRSLPFENWLFRILSNLFVDGLRRKPKMAALSLNQPIPGADSDESFLPEVPDEESDPERLVLRDVMDERLQAALASLPKDFRTAVVLCDIEGLSYEEIARRMGTSIGTVRSRIHRGRTALRRAMMGAAPASRSRMVLEGASS